MTVVNGWSFAEREEVRVDVGGSIERMSGKAELEALGQTCLLLVRHGDCPGHEANQIRDHLVGVCLSMILLDDSQSLFHE